MVASLLTWSGASVGGSASTQRRMPPRIAWESKGLAVVAVIGMFGALGEDTPTVIPGRAPDRDDFSSNRHPALSFCLSMIFSENRFPLFRIMLQREPRMCNFTS